MLRRLSPFILIVAVLIAAEPLLHNHPLSTGPGSAGAACAICATGVGRLPTVSVSVGAPQVLRLTFIGTALPAVAAEAPLPRSPRAPPAA